MCEKIIHNYRKSLRVTKFIRLGTTPTKQSREREEIQSRLTAASTCWDLAAILSFTNDKPVYNIIHNIPKS